MNEFSSRASGYRDETDERGTRQRRTARGAIVMMAIFAVGIIAVLVYSAYKKKTTYTSWTEVSSYDVIPDAHTLRSENGYIQYNNDGAIGYDLKNRSSWRISYNLNDPIASSSGDYAAFAERGGRTVHVTNGSGTNDVINVSEKIYDICVASQGVTAIRTDDGERDHIYLYDTAGNLLLDIRTEVRASGFPITMALSSDARKLVTSYYKVGQSQESWVTFYNFGDVGQNYADKIVGSYSFEDMFIPDIHFVGEDRVLVTGDSMSVLYKFREIPEELSRYNINSGIASVAYCDTGFVLAASRTDGLKTLSIYDTEGKETGKIETGMKYDHIFIDENEVFLILGDSAVIYRSAGDEKFRSGFDADIDLIFPNQGDTTYTIVGKTASKMIRLTTKSEENQGLEGIE